MGKVKCGQCPHEASNPSKLKKHVDVVHDQIKEFMCDHCEYVTAYKRHLETHIRHNHYKSDFEGEVILQGQSDGEGEVNLRYSSSLGPNSDKFQTFFKIRLICYRLVSNQLQSLGLL